jgi:hypothetical protein
MPTRIFSGNTAYEYSSWACHTSATMEFFCLPLLTFKEQVLEERVDATNLWLNINRCCAIRYEVHLPVRQKPNLTTLEHFFIESFLKRGAKKFLNIDTRLNGGGAGGSHQSSS